MNMDELMAAKAQAVEEEDFLRAAELKKQIEELKAESQQDDEAQRRIQEQIEALTLEKKEAVANEDYLRAAELKKEIEGLQNGGSSAATTTPAKTAPPRTPSSSHSAAAKTFAPYTSKPIPTSASPMSVSSPATPSMTAASTPTSTPSRATPIKMPMKTNDGPSSASKSNSRTPERRAPPRTQSSTLNPIKADPKLKSLIEELTDITSARAFKCWKSSFLNRFEDFLHEDGSKPAQDAYTNFRDSMQTFGKHVTLVEQNVNKGDLSVDRTTVKGRNSLNEMNKVLVSIIEEERNLIPAKSKQERNLGYTKFHLGAVLVRDGFKEYQRMNTCCEILTHFKDVSLVGVADKQQIGELENYAKSMKRFRDIMADLGLYEVMLKCWEFGMDNEEFIFIDLKTGAIGGLSIKEAIDRGHVHTIKNDKGSDIGFREAITDEDDKNAVMALVSEVLKL